MLESLPVEEHMRASYAKPSFPGIHLAHHQVIEDMYVVLIKTE